MEMESRNSSRISHGTLLGIAGLVLTGLIAVGSLAWAIRDGMAETGKVVAANAKAIEANTKAIEANTKAIAELRGLFFEQVSSRHDHTQTGGR